MNFNLINGNIITLDQSNPIANSVTIENDKILNIDNINSKYQNIDLCGATVIPGFVDSHFHLTNLGKRLDMLNLKKCNSSHEIANLVIEKSKTVNDNDWILGFGWDQTRWDENEFPKKTLLNDLNIMQPVMLTRIDGHSCWVNDNAIKLSGLDSSIQIDGGDIVNGCILIDNAMNPIQESIPKSDDKMIQKWIKMATKIIISRGITNIHDAWQTSDMIKNINFLIEKNEFPIRCYGMLASHDQQLINHYFNSGHYNSTYYTIRSVKAFIDGALGSRGAALFEPYSDDNHNCGLILISHDEFNELARNCKKAGFQLCTHAIGDKGNSMVIDTYSKTMENISDHRWRIEHAQMVRDEDISKFYKNGIIPSMQPSHCTSDMRWMKDRLGEHRIHRISRWKSFIDSGCKIPGGSDCPIEEGNPLFEYYAAISRKDHKGHPHTGWQPQECITRLDALKMLTSWGAYGEFAENRRGKIKIGFDADFTVMSENILTCDFDKILKTKILMTIINGKILKNIL